MRHRWWAGLLAVLAVAAWSAEPIPNIQAQVYFSPNGGGTDAVVTALASAHKTVLVQAYSFTSTPIAKALAAAKERGVEVRIILDKSQRTGRYSGADFVAHAGIPVLIDEVPAIAHSKVMIIDSDLVITGSFNFTSAAESKNVENLLVLRSAALAQLYRENWLARAAVSVPYVPTDERAPP
jgi:phosphatidylserine/phosphatidylglycerophosphate/cardiolipin synthase-like enzyme